MLLGWSRDLFYANWTPLHSARVWAGLSQGDLARVVGTSRETISSLERGASIPAVTLAIGIAQALGLTVEELFGSDELR